MPRKMFKATVKVYVEWEDDETSPSLSDFQNTLERGLVNEYGSENICSSVTEEDD